MGSFFSRKTDDELKTCLICEESKRSGIHLLNYFICEECEFHIVHTETNDKGYRYYLERLKKVRNALVEMKKDKAQ